MNDPNQSSDLKPLESRYPGLVVEVPSQNDEGPISVSLKKRLALTSWARDMTTELNRYRPTWNTTDPKSLDTRLDPGFQCYPNLNIRVVKRQKGAVSSLLRARLRNAHAGRTVLDMATPEWKSGFQKLEHMGLFTLPPDAFDVTSPEPVDHNVSGHTIHLVGGEEGEVGTFIAEQKGDSYLVTFKYRGKEIQAQEADCFEAFSLLRLCLYEEEGLIPFCYGASMNVYVPKELRESAHGLMGVRLMPGKKPSAADFVRIFDSSPDVVPASVAQQEEFCEEWLENEDPADHLS